MEKSTYLTFELADELFAVNVTRVLEVIEQQQITYIPNSPEHLLGILNFRGEVLPVVDTSKKFSLPVSAPETRKIIVFDLSSNEKQYLVSAMVDGVNDVIEVHESEIKSIPEIGLRFDSRYLTGVIHQEDHFILRIDPERVFSAMETEVVSQES